MSQILPMNPLFVFIAGGAVLNAGLFLAYRSGKSFLPKSSNFIAASRFVAFVLTVVGLILVTLTALTLLDALGFLKIGPTTVVLITLWGWFLGSIAHLTLKGIFSIGEKSRKATFG